MKVTKNFLDAIEKAELKPEDFFMLEAGYFHAYCKKINNQAQFAEELDPDKHFIPVSRFEQIERRPEDHEKHDRGRHLNIYTSQESRVQPKHSKNMELFLHTAPAGSTMIQYWSDKERRAQRDVYIGRITLNDVKVTLMGWAFEVLTVESLGMCFEYENDAMLFAAMMPNIREELKEKRLGERSVAERKMPW